VRRIGPRTIPLVLFVGVLLLSLLGAGTGLVSFLLLRAGYGFVVWGLLPFLALLVAAVILGAVLWWAAGGTLPGVGRKQEPRAGSSREGPHGRDDV
jgi:hypothetical protein